MAGCRDDVLITNTRRTGRETAMSPLQLPTTTPYEPSLPCQLTTPNVPLLAPSAPSKKKKEKEKDKPTPTSHLGEDQIEIPHSRDAGLGFEHIFVKELRNKTKKKTNTSRCPFCFS